MVGDESSGSEEATDFDSLRRGRLDSWLRGKTEKSGSWIAPLLFEVKPKDPVDKVRPGRQPRSICVRGVNYPSITACRKVTGFSTMKIYYLIGEGHRNTKYMKRK
jgi:hypothetical protein